MMNDLVVAPKDPLTSNLYVGFIVPIPTFPVISTAILSSLTVSSPMTNLPDFMFISHFLSSFSSLAILESACTLGEYICSGLCGVTPRPRLPFHR